MSWVARQFQREKGGTIVGNLIRRGVQKAVAHLTYGFVDTDKLGYTDGHLNGGRDSVGQDIRQNLNL